VNVTTDRVGAAPYSQTSRPTADVKSEEEKHINDTTEISVSNHGSFCIIHDTFPGLITGLFYEATFASSSTHKVS
jgi:hypothetical protein